MKKVTTVALLALSLSATAQKLPRKAIVKYNTMKVIDSQVLDKGGSVSLYVDKCDKIAFIGQLGVGAELASGNLFKFHVNAEADYFFKKWISLHAGGEYSFIDLERIMSGTNTNNNISSIGNSSFMEGGVRVLVVDSKKKIKHHIVLETSYSHRTTTEYYIDPKLPARRMIAVRGGVYANTAVVNTDMNEKVFKKDDNGAIVAKDGTLLSNAYTNSRSMGAYVGVSTITIIDAITKNSIKKGSIYRSRNFKEIYADVLFANTAFDPITDAAGIHDIAANATSSFQTSPLGARIGVKNTKEKGRLNASYKLEVGSRPGVKGSGLYVNFALGFGLVK